MCFNPDTGKGCESCGNRSVWSLSKDKDWLWDYDTGDEVNAVAINSVGDAIIVGKLSNGATIWSLDSSGNLNWSFNTGDEKLAVAIDSNDNAIVGGLGGGGLGHGTVISLDIDGNKNWSYATQQAIYDIAIDSGDNIAVCGYYQLTSPYNTVFCFDSAGNLLWNYATPDSAKAVRWDSQGNVIVAALGVYSIAGGVLNWSASPSSLNGLTVDDIDNIIVGGSMGTNKTVWAYDKDGNFLWDYNTGANGTVSEIELSPSPLLYLTALANTVSFAGGAETGLRCDGHGRSPGDVIRLVGTNNFDGIWTLTANTTSLFLAIPTAYILETMTGDEIVYLKGAVVVACQNGVHGLDENGAYVWSQLVSFAEGLEIDSEGNVMAGWNGPFQTNTLFNFSSSGSIRWTYLIGDALDNPDLHDIAFRNNDDFVAVGRNVP